MDVEDEAEPDIRAIRQLTVSLRGTRVAFVTDPFPIRPGPVQRQRSYRRALRPRFAGDTTTASPSFTGSIPSRVANDTRRAQSRNACR